MKTYLAKLFMQLWICYSILHILFFMSKNMKNGVIEPSYSNYFCVVAMMFGFVWFIEYQRKD